MKERFEGLLNLLDTQKNLTLFAPSNNAFKLVDKDRLDKVKLLLSFCFLAASFGGKINFILRNASYLIHEISKKNFICQI